MKTVLITGATSGIGAALLKQYHQQGYQVIACGRNQEKLASYSQQYSNIKTLAFDINQAEQIAKAAEQISAIDILLLNAGDCQYIDDTKNFDSSIFSRIIQTNLISLGYLLEQFLNKLASGGQVVFVSSSASLLPFPRAEAYGASKAGVDYLANSLRLDLKPEHIDVTLVHPGFIKTPLTDKNTFAMPFLMTSEEAAERIFNGVSKRKQYLHFPKRLTIFLKLFSYLPGRIWQYFISRSMT